MSGNERKAVIKAARQLMPFPQYLNQGGEEGSGPQIFFWKNKNRCINKCSIKVCVSCSWQYPGTSAPSAKQLTVPLYLCSSKATNASLKGRHSSSKNPWCICDSQTKGKSVSQTRGHWFGLQANQWFFIYVASLKFDCLCPFPQYLNRFVLASELLYALVNIHFWPHASCVGVEQSQQLNTDYSGCQKRPRVTLETRFPRSDSG